MMPYLEELGEGLVITDMQIGHAAQLEQLQVTIFPSLADEERFKKEHYLKHLEIFPEGQFVALDGEKVVGATSTIRYAFDFDHIDHTFEEIIEGGWLTSHQPEGNWLYGADIGTHPDYRGKGIAKALYRARQAVVHQFGLKGQVTVGMLSGYGALKGQMTAEEYYQQLLGGQRKDPTVSAQMKVGFEPKALVKDYVQDPVCDNYGVLIVLDAAKDI